MADQLRVPPPPSALSWLLAAEQHMRRDRIGSTVSTDEEGQVSPAAVSSDRSATVTTTNASTLKFGVSQILAKSPSNSQTKEQIQLPPTGKDPRSRYILRTFLNIFVVYKPTLPGHLQSHYAPGSQ